MVKHSFFDAPERRKGRLSSGRTQPSASRPTRSCTSLLQPASGMSEFWTRQAPGHDLHEKRLRGRKRRYPGQQPGTKSGCRPADKLAVDRWFCSSLGLHSIWRVLPKRRLNSCLRCPGGRRSQIFSQSEPSASRLARPRPRPPALPCAALPRPAATRLWYFIVLNSTGFEKPESSKGYPGILLVK